MSNNDRDGQGGLLDLLERTTRRPGPGGPPLPAAPPSSRNGQGLQPPLGVAGLGELLGRVPQAVGAAVGGAAREANRARLRVAARRAYEDPEGEAPPGMAELWAKVPFSSGFWGRLADDTLTPDDYKLAADAMGTDLSPELELDIQTELSRRLLQRTPVRTATAGGPSRVTPPWAGGTMFGGPSATEMLRGGGGTPGGGGGGGGGPGNQPVGRSDLAGGFLPAGEPGSSDIGVIVGPVDRPAARSSTGRITYEPLKLDGRDTGITLARYNGIVIARLRETTAGTITEITVELTPEIEEVLLNEGLATTADLYKFRAQRDDAYTAKVKADNAVLESEREAKKTDIANRLAQQEIDLNEATKEWTVAAAKYSVQAQMATIEATKARTATEYETQLTQQVERARSQFALDQAKKLAPLTEELLKEQVAAYKTAREEAERKKVQTEVDNAFAAREYGQLTERMRPRPPGWTASAAATPPALGPPEDFKRLTTAAGVTPEDPVAQMAYAMGQQPEPPPTPAAAPPTDASRTQYEQLATTAGVSPEDPVAQMAYATLHQPAPAEEPPPAPVEPPPVPAAPAPTTPMPVDEEEERRRREGR